MDRRLVDGAYDELVTAGLDALLIQPEITSETDPVDRAETTDVLAAHLEKVATRVLDSLPFERRLAVANAVLASLSAEAGDLVAGGPRLLHSVGPAVTRPQSPLRRADLLINARHEPALHEELAAEIASANQVDL